LVLSHERYRLRGANPPVRRTRLGTRGQQQVLKFIAYTEEAMQVIEEIDDFEPA